MGGMIGNDSCGVHSVMAGKTVHNVIELEVLTYDGLRLRVGPTGDEELAAIIALGDRRGHIYAGLKKVRDHYAPLIRERYPDIPRRVSGYGLDQLLPENGFNVARALVGSENNCVIVLEATLRLVHSPPARSTLVLGYPDMPSASRHVSTVLAHGVIGLEAIDDVIMANIREKRLVDKKDALMPRGGGWLLAEFGADTRKDADAMARSAHGGASEGTGSSHDALPQGSGRQRSWCGPSARRGWRPPPAAPATSSAGPAGRTSASPPRRSATTCATSSRSKPATATGEPSTVTSATAASTPASTST